METLLAMSFLFITSYGVFRVSDVAGKNAKLVQSELDLKDLRMAVFQGLGNKASCVHNLKKGGGNSLKDSIVSLETTPPNSMRIIEKDQLFKPSIRIKGLDIDKNNKKFSVYYTKEGLGKYETLLKPDGTKGICEPASSKADKTAGCYSLSCKIDYACSNNDCNGAGDKCSLTDCAGEGIVVAGGGANCYKVDSDTATGGKALVGCGGTDQAGGTQTTALGFSAGKVNTGNNNTFLGAYAGSANTTAQDNTFIGKKAGWKNTTGSFNTFIGLSAGEKNTTPGGNTFIGEKAGLNNTRGGQNTFIGAGAGQTNTTGENNIAIGRHVSPDSPSGDDQINIGNIIKAKPGYIKICNGSNCLKIKGPNFSCPDGEFMKGIKSDGTPDCEPACVGGQTMYETLELENPGNNARRTITYEVGGPVPDYTGETLVSKRRQCKCPEGTNWSETNNRCEGCPDDNTKWISAESACMECKGVNNINAYWFLTDGHYDCKCGYDSNGNRGSIKKKVG